MSRKAERLFFSDSKKIHIKLMCIYIFNYINVYVYITCLILYNTYCYIPLTPSSCHAQNTFWGPILARNMIKFLRDIKMTIVFKYRNGE